MCSVVWAQIKHTVMPQNSDSSYYEKVQGARQSRPPSRANKRRESGSSDRHQEKYRLIIKHDCVNKEENPPTRSQSLPPRPPTRRKPSDMPIPRQLSSRARSSGPGSRKTSSTQKSRSSRSQHSAKSTLPVQAHFTASIQPHSSRQAEHMKVKELSPTAPMPAPRNAKPKRDTSYKNSISDHEYLQFSLRITEDIIRNDLYTNKEMRRVFNSHLEANRGRLDMDKMTEQIDNLCKELNIPLDETQDGNPMTRTEMKNKRSKRSCICTPTSRHAESKDCECGSARCLPFQCAEHSQENNTTSYSSGSTNTTPNSQGTVKGKIEEHGTEIYVHKSQISEDNVSQFEIYDNPLSTPVTPVSLSIDLLTDSVNELRDTVPYYEEVLSSAQVRHSLGFLQLPLLPSLSRVTEKTEPTTSCETMDSKLENSEGNIESVSEFDATDVLPLFEQEHEQFKIPDTLSLSDSMQSKKSIKFGNIIKVPHSESQLEGENDYLVSIEPGNEIQAVPEATDSVESSTESSNVLWVITPQIQPETTEHTFKHNEEKNSNSEKIIASVPLSESQMKILYSAPYSFCLQSVSTRDTVPEAKSEPIKYSNKPPIPTPRSCTSSDIASAKESNRNDCKSCNSNKKKHKSQFAQQVETLNVKSGPGNSEEFILLPGPIYVPKSNIMPMSMENNKNIPNIITPEIFKNRNTFSKDAMVNTDEESLVKSCNGNVNQVQSTTSSKFKVIKEPSSVVSNVSSCYDSDISLTYSQLHNRAAKGNYPANGSQALSIVSKIMDMPKQTTPSVQKNMAKPQKGFINPQCSITESDQNNAVMNCKNKCSTKYQFSQQADSISNTVKVPNGASNSQEECILIATPVCVPKSSVPTKLKVTKGPCNVSKVNSCYVDPSQSVSTNSTPVGDSDTSSTYSQLHNRVVNVTHATSFASNFSNMPKQPPPISESMFMTDNVRKSFGKPPKALINQQCPIRESDQNNALIHLNDYDLTPQRDSNKTAYTDNSTDSRQHFYKDKFTGFSKEGLLLGDEYEIKNDYASNKSSVSSCYDNGLPYTICRFYPNISTQTYSADFLLPTPINNTTTEPIQVQRQSILKKTIPLKEQVGEQELEKQEIHKQETPELEKQEFEPIEKSRKSDQGSTLFMLDKSVSFSVQDKQSSESLSELIKLEQDEENIFEDESSHDSNLQIGHEEFTIEDDDEEHDIAFNEIESETSIEENYENQDGVENRDDNDDDDQDGVENRDDDDDDDQDGVENRDDNENEDDDENQDDDEDQEEPMFEELDLDRPNAYAKRASIMMTIKQVTTDLEKFRKTEIPVDEFVHTRYNIPMSNRTLNVADDLLEQQALSLAKQKAHHHASAISDVSDTNSYTGSKTKLPFIEVSNSEPQLDIKKEDSNELETISCCGIKTTKKRTRRDIVKLDTSAHKIPNISIIPDDQLFEMEPRRPTMAANYGSNGRKSLRFDYSAMQEYSQASPDPGNFISSIPDIKDFTSPYSTEQSIANLKRGDSIDSVEQPVTRNQLVSYDTGSTPNTQQKSEDTDSIISTVQFNEKVMTLEPTSSTGTTHNSVVDILKPQTESMSSIRVLENDHESVKDTTSLNDSIQS